MPTGPGPVAAHTIPRGVSQRLVAGSRGCAVGLSGWRGDGTHASRHRRHAHLDRLPNPARPQRPAAKLMTGPERSAPTTPCAGDARQTKPWRHGMGPVVAVGGRRSRATTPAVADAVRAAREPI